MKVLGSSENFLGIVEPEFCTYSDANYVIQSVPYEHTSSYLQGSANGPAAIINASQFVEFYDEETNTEAFRAGIATLESINFNGKTDSAAVELIEQHTIKLLNDNKFVVPHVDNIPRTGDLIVDLEKWQKNRTEKANIPRDKILVFVPSGDIPMPIVIQVLAQLKEHGNFARVILGGGFAL